MAAATGSRVERLEVAHRLLRELDGVIDECELGEVRALVGGVRVLRSELDRLSVHLTRRADDLAPTPGPLGGGESLWGAAGPDDPDADDPDGDDDPADPDEDDADGPPPPPPPDPAEARREAGRARVCRLLPRVADAFAEGRVTAGHLDVLASVMLRRDRALLELFCSSDADIAQAASELGCRELRVWCHDLFTRLEDQLGRQLADRQRRDTHLRWRTDPVTGMMMLFGQFHPELGQHLRHTITAHATAAANHPDRLTIAGVGGPHPQRRSDPAHLAAWALAQLVLTSPSDHDDAGAGVGVELAIVVRPDGTARYPTGDPVDTTTVARLLCDARLRRILLDDHGVPLDVGLGRRLATPEQRLALSVIYDSCVEPGCQVPFHQCEIHHIIPYDPGPTDLDNLEPRCTTHHHQHHANNTWHTHDPPDTS